MKLKLDELQLHSGQILISSITTETQQLPLIWGVIPEVRVSWKDSLTLREFSLIREVYQNVRDL